ncbi:Tic22 family protein (plasmid) [Thalassoporum mexicanum PCC 7367]|uniref:Tic22 family protein n=1 Tax=Thalassoporum mexicanum TaxID=3457544 RepID=UPI00029FBCA9|nr:Tic22 family protein [Pseudanabaena sp. PCC 7367]AFY72112.1 Tic22 family protein [Pseudanabaena sp. PCC 7367]
MRMKSLTKFAANTCLVGAIALSPIFITPVADKPAFASSTESIETILQDIPVFFITDQADNPLISTNSKSGKKFLVLFLSPEEAQEVFRRAQADGAQIAHIRAVSLAQFYDTLNTFAEADITVRVQASKQALESASFLQEQQREQSQ